MSSTTDLWLLPLDDSPAALHAVAHTIGLVQKANTAPRLLLLNVQSALSKDISRFIARDSITEFHQENGEKALSPAKQLLDNAGIAYEAEVLVGEIAPTIATLASERQCSQIVMGARGLGSVMGVLMGSITAKVIHLSAVPILLVK